MQLVPRYLVSNRTTIVANEAGFITEYRPVYSRQLQVYKGIDNVLEFKLLNADQKPIDVSNYTPKFQAFDENRQLVVEHNGEMIIGDDSAASRGLFKVTITENDLLNVKQQFLNYSIHLVDLNEDNVITYSDSHFNNSGIIKISAEAYPGPKTSKEVIVPFPISAGGDTWVSEHIDAQPGINGNEAIHTAVIYTSGYIGDVTIQATLENQVTNQSAWSDVTTLTFDGTETITPVNFNGVFSYIKFIASANPYNKITKVLVRN